MAEKRLAHKDFARLRRFIKSANKGGDTHRKWMEERADELGCYLDKWIPRLGFFTDDDNKRVKTLPKLTKEARRRDTELSRLGERVNDELNRIAVKLKTFPDLIDVKTGKVTMPGELHEEVGEVEEDKGEAAGAKAEGIPVDEEEKP